VQKDFARDREVSLWDSQYCIHGRRKGKEIIKNWMRPRLVIRASDYQFQSRNSSRFDAASSDTVESEGQQIMQC
jgi:hypothetical protein